MAGGAQNNQNNRPGARRAPLPKAKLPGQGPQARARQVNAPPPAKRPSSPLKAPGGKRPSSPVQQPPAAGTGQTDARKPSAPVQSTRRTSSPVNKRNTNPGADEPARPKTKKEPATIEELIPVLVRHAVKRDEGLQISEFDAKFIPRIRAFVPESLQRMEKEIINEYLVDIAHALYVSIVVGQFATRPVLCGVRAAELATDVIERVMQDIDGQEDKRITRIRAANLLVGLTLNAVRLLESASLGSQDIKSFTDKYERAVITTYGLKTQAEATGAAPWVGDKSSPLDKRIGRAINTMSNVFGDYIGEHGTTMDDAQYDEVMGEFDNFMERFAPYIEGGRSGAEERRRKLARGGTAHQKTAAKVEPLDIREVRTRPAGVEIVLTDARILFVSAADAKRIGAAAEGEIDDTAKRERQALEKRRQETGEGLEEVDEDAAMIAEIEAQMKANKGKNL
ncbi:MAG: hypothetical protein K8I27_07610 [Planctomycetes bacterium]|nr:hypothetical protein [Planctomycetota bacterium]